MAERGVAPGERKQRVILTVTVPELTRDEAMALWTKISNTVEPYEEAVVRVNIEEPRTIPPFVGSHG